MLISRALAGHGVVDTGSSGRGDALLIILGIGILFILLYFGRKRWRGRNAGRDDSDQSRVT